MVSSELVHRLEQPLDRGEIELGSTERPPPLEVGDPRLGLVTSGDAWAHLSPRRVGWQETGAVLYNTGP